MKQYLAAFGTLPLTTDWQAQTPRGEVLRGPERGLRAYFRSALRLFRKRLALILEAPRAYWHRGTPCFRHPRGAPFPVTHGR